MKSYTFIWKIAYMYIAVFLKELDEVQGGGGQKSQTTCKKWVFSANFQNFKKPFGTLKEYNYTVLSLQNNWIWGFPKRNGGKLKNGGT